MYKYLTDMSSLGSSERQFGRPPVLVINEGGDRAESGSYTSQQHSLSESTIESGALGTKVIATEKFTGTLHSEETEVNWL